MIKYGCTRFLQVLLFPKLGLMKERQVDFLIMSLYNLAGNVWMSISHLQVTL